MKRPTKIISVNLSVNYVPIPQERVMAWRAGMLLLLNLIRERRENIKANAMKQVNDKNKSPSSPAEG